MMQVKCWARCLAHGARSLVGGNIIPTKPHSNPERWTGKSSLFPIYRWNDRLREVKSLIQIHRATNWLAEPQSRLHPQLGLAAPLPLGVCFPNPSVPGALEISSLLDNPQGLPRDRWPSALSPVAALAWAAPDPGFWGQALAPGDRPGPQVPFHPRPGAQKAEFSPDSASAQGWPRRGPLAPSGSQPPHLPGRLEGVGGWEAAACAQGFAGVPANSEAASGHSPEGLSALGEETEETVGNETLGQ